MAWITFTTNAVTCKKTTRKINMFTSRYAMFSNVVAVNISPVLVNKTLRHFTIARPISQCFPQMTICVNNMANAVAYKRINRRTKYSHRAPPYIPTWTLAQRWRRKRLDISSSLAHFLLFLSQTIAWMNHEAAAVSDEEQKRKTHILKTCVPTLSPLTVPRCWWAKRLDMSW